MANLIIKSSADNLVLQGSDASPAITVGATGTTTFAENATLSGTANNLGTVTAGTIGSSVVFPAGHPVAYKAKELNGTELVTTSTSYVEAHTSLRITHALSNAANQLVFSVSATKMYVGGSVGFVDIAKTTAVSSGLLTRNIIHCMNAQSVEQDTMTGIGLYLPGVTTEFTYTVVYKTDSGSFYVQNSTTNTAIRFTLTETVI